MHLLNIQSPRLALVRLLRGIGACQCSKIPSQSSTDQQEYNRLLKVKVELAERVAELRNNLNGVPCVITLASEIGQLKEVTQGLARENRVLIMQLQMNQQQRGLTAEQLNEYNKLQREYTQLLRALEQTNDQNQRLIANLVKC